MNPAFSLAMIMNTLGPELGDYLYPIIAKHSEEAEAYVVEWNEKRLFYEKAKGEKLKELEKTASQKT